MTTDQTTARSAGEMRLRLLWLAPMILSLSVYWSAPWNELVWDDPIVFERQIQTMQSLRDVFVVPDGVAEWSPYYYRPVVVLSYLLDLRLFAGAELKWMELSALQRSGVFISSNETAISEDAVINRAQIAGLHLANVIYHAVTSVLLWMLAARLFARAKAGVVAATVVACVFAVHPIHVESVGWIAGRSDVLATMFLVPSITLALVWRDSGAHWAIALAAGLYWLALMSKEVAIAALLIIPAALLLAPAGRAVSATGGPDAFRRRPLKWLTCGLYLAGATGVYFFLRQADGAAYGAPLDVSWLNYLTRLEKSAAYYLVKVVWPWPQSSFTGWTSAPGSLLSNIALLGCFGLAYVGVRLLRRDRDGLLLLALIWFGASLVPALAVALRSISSTPLAERYLYLPSVGMALLLGTGFVQLAGRGREKPALVVMLLIVSAYSFGTVQRGGVWSDNLALWTDTTRKVPEFGEPWNQLGVVYLSGRDYSNAIEAFRRAVDATIGPYGRASANHNIAIIYQLRNELQSAEKYYRAALAEQVATPDINYGLGVLYKMQAAQLEQGNAEPERVAGKLLAATEQFELTLRMIPYHALARWQLASVLLVQGRVEEAAQNPQRAGRLYRRAQQELGKLATQNPAFTSRAEVRQAVATAEAGLQRVQNGVLRD